LITACVSQDKENYAVQREAKKQGASVETERAEQRLAAG